MSTKKLLILLAPLVLLAGFLLALQPAACEGPKCGGASVSGGIISATTIQEI